MFTVIFHNDIAGHVDAMSPGERAPLDVLVDKLKSIPDQVGRKVGGENSYYAVAPSPDLYIRYHVDQGAMYVAILTIQSGEEARKEQRALALEQIRKMQP